MTIVEDGKQVEEGDLLVELDASALEDQINTQRIAFEKARATKIQSEKTWSVAKISVTEYLEGTYKQALQDAEAAITIAEENLRSAQNSLEHSDKMFRKGYVSSLELEGQRFAVQRSELELASAKTAKEVLENNMTISTALPCRISVYEEDGKVKIATIRPTYMLDLFDSPALKSIAQSVEETMIKIISVAVS